jgi:hypothetical protein
MPPSLDREEGQTPVLLREWSVELVPIKLCSAGVLEMSSGGTKSRWTGAAPLGALR